MTSAEKIEKIETVDSIYGRISSFQNDLITKQIKNFGGHTRPEFSFATSLLSHDEKIFDIGAHIGTFTLLAARKTSPSAKILAVEGNNGTHSILESNISAVSWAEAFKAFISDGSTQYQYVEDDKNTGGGYLEKGFDTSTISIDHLVEKFFEPSYIKIDIEGLEMTALNSSAYIKDRKPIIYTEVGKGALRRCGSSSEELISFFKTHGYEIYVNIGQRNAPHDFFQCSKMPRHWPRKKPMFDILCVPNDSEKNDIINHRTNWLKMLGRAIYAQIA